MRRFPAVVALSLVLLACGAGPLLAQFADAPLSPAEVVEIDRALDGTVVTVEGEAIGEHLRALGGGRWVNLLGDEVGLGIWVTDEMAAQIENFGDYRQNGDTVRVVGTVNVACVRHGGEFDVHADSLQIIARGEARPVGIQPLKGVGGIAGLMVAFSLWRLYRRRRDRRMI